MFGVFLFTELHVATFTAADAERLYPDQYDRDDWNYGPSNYQPLLDEMGTILVQVDDSDYQGDSRLLLRDGGRYGFLVFGWGSCSGCDELQACSSYQDIADMANRLASSIPWFDTLAEVQTYVADTATRELSHYYHKSEWAEFAAKVAVYQEPT